ncbi:hypothetical protein XarbCFBP6827_09705 [Xanthomonas arboricola]|nr:hypothetical protein XarbCFBP6827_09705 [Xanthomonas arboricola]
MGRYIILRIATTKQIFQKATYIFGNWHLSQHLPKILKISVNKFKSVAMDSQKKFKGRFSLFTVHFH